MAPAIDSSSSVTYAPAIPVAPQQTKTSAKDSDGDNNASKVGEVEKPKATSGNVGTQVNTTA